MDKRQIDESALVEWARLQGLLRAVAIAAEALDALPEVADKLRDDAELPAEAARVRLVEELRAVKVACDCTAEFSDRGGVSFARLAVQRGGYDALVAELLAAIGLITLEVER